MNDNGTECIDVDFNALARGLQRLQDSVTADHNELVFDVTEFLQRIPFPPGYVDKLRSEMLMMLNREQKVDVTYVYLAFYGMDYRASHLKIGVARDVQKRLAGIKTGNPLPNLWTYAAWFSSKKEALVVESALLRHMAADSVHGEWVSVGTLSEQASLAVVESLTEVANDTINSFANFKPLEA